MPEFRKAVVGPKYGKWKASKRGRRTYWAGASGLSVKRFCLRRKGERAHPKIVVLKKSTEKNMCAKNIAAANGWKPCRNYIHMWCSEEHITFNVKLCSEILRSWGSMVSDCSWSGAARWTGYWMSCMVENMIWCICWTINIVANIWMELICKLKSGRTLKHLEWKKKWSNMVLGIIVKCSVILSP